MGDLRRAAVLGGNRIPFARANGPYARASNQDMLTAALDGLVARFGLQNARLGEVAAGAVLKHSRDFNPTRVVPETPRNAEPRTGMSMGQHAAITAREWGISREEQDQFALSSHRNLAAAWKRGFFDDLVTPYLGLQKDQTMRPDASMESLARLKPVFGKDGAATMTAGNSTPLSDGASAVLLSTAEWAQERRLPILAYLVDAETAAVDYVHGGEG